MGNFKYMRGRERIIKEDKKRKKEWEILNMRERGWKRKNGKFQIYKRERGRDGVIVIIIEKRHR